MALTGLSLFRYGYTIDSSNNKLDFRAVALETPRTATLSNGYYTLDGLCREIERAMEAVDASNNYTVSADRSYSGGLANRVTITTSGTFLSLLFSSGPNTGVTVASTIGFAVSDRTGATTYTGTSSTGTQVLTDRAGYNYLGPDLMQNVTGALNISVSGVKEAVVLNVQQYWQVQFKYITASDVTTYWTGLMQWMIQARPIEFTPLYTDYSTYYEGTLESQAGDSKGIGYKFTEMLPQFPNFYDTGIMKFRKRLAT